MSREHLRFCESHSSYFDAGAAQTATHCAVFAQLRIKGVGYGPKTFIVPLRNPSYVLVVESQDPRSSKLSHSTFELLPGVAIGDIGKKMGRDGIDNGWM